MDILSQFGWTDFIDVLIVAYVFYRILLLIRRTRAVRMAVGMIFLAVFFYIARRVGLTTVDWLLTNVFTYIVFAIIVLFQNEIRRALTTLGRTPFFRSLTRHHRDPTDDIVTAATALAAKRRGAIVVFQREMGLNNYIEGGIRLDAAVSYDLLMSVFNPDSPLHDGAVIIREGRIAAASCFLPLTLNPRLSRELGSRHRAAIGISEETDAVAVVVSEETGTISVVVDGRITRKLDAATLTRELQRLLPTDGSTPDGIAVESASEKGLSGEEAAAGVGK
ncbi:MAG: diadenylate cyclase CdaA [Acidobacteriota bacterium]